MLISTVLGTGNSIVNKTLNSLPKYNMLGRKEEEKMIRKQMGKINVMSGGNSTMEKKKALKQKK